VLGEVQIRSRETVRWMIAPRRLGLLSLAISFATATLVAVRCLTPGLGAQFGPIDDHQYLEWLGPDGAFTVPDAVRAYLGSEVGSFGSTSRFRPVYYLVQVSLTLLLTNHVAWWYASVMAVFVAACGTLGFVTSWWVRCGLSMTRGPGSSFLVLGASSVATLLFCSMGAWRGVATRLGPSEGLATAGLAVALLGATIVLAWHVRERVALGGTLLVLGTWIGVMSKENYLPLAFLPVVVAVFSPREVMHRRARLVVGVTGVAPGVVLLAALSSPVVNGRDVYGQSTGMTRIQLALDSIFGTYLWYWVPTAVAALLSVAALTLAGPVSQRRLVAGFWAALALAAIWRLYDSWIYAGGYTVPRYEMVWQALKLIVLVGSLALSVAALTLARSWKVRCLTIPAVALAGALTASAGLAAPATLRDLRTESVANAEATVAYDLAMRRVGREINAF